AGGDAEPRGRATATQRRDHLRGDAVGRRGDAEGDGAGRRADVGLRAQRHWRRRVERVERLLVGTDGLDGEEGHRRHEGEEGHRELDDALRMTPRAFAIDLDGTLLGSDHRVTPANRRAVRAAVDAGFEIIIATARWYQLALEVANELELSGPAIACSGAEVRRLSDGADLFDVRLPAAFAEQLFSR